ISKIIAKLESDYMITLEGTSYKITTSGIEDFERIATPTEVNENITQRQMILTELKKEYDVNINTKLNHEILSQRVNSQDRIHLLSQVHYLEQIGFVDLDMAMGGTFDIKLNARGTQAFENIDTRIAEYNENGYNTLYRLENHLRKFIERKLRERYGATWWTDGVLQTLRAKADSRKEDEHINAWEVSKTSSDLEYLEFPDLGKIIVNQWSIFESIFSDQQATTTKLNELEKIRNAIAHTRTLSGDSFTRLNMYSEEIFNITNR
ncbi:MAG: hypothetical protein COV65_07230, partial [Nitrosopumilales archaeon CG11_big_fil_rev_8_21_14_0_20_33_24]